MRLRTMIRWSAVVVLVLAVGLAALILSFDMNDYRDELAALATHALGRAVMVEGSLGLDL